jgi:uncharacterized SAM-binding protein YcdF (DUF218 family)
MVSRLARPARLRLLWDVFQPSNSLFMLFALGFVLRFAGRRRIAAWMMSISFAVFAAIMVLPVSSYLATTLETRFPAPALPAHVDGIITLGGPINTRASEQWGRPQINGHVERLTEAMMLSRRYPEATLLISGGHYDPSDRLSEAPVARDLLVELGHPAERMLIEDRSRTTWENGVFSRELAQPKPGQVWVLVTSAFHMPRAVGVFRALGWQVIPYPADYFMNQSVVSVGHRLAQFDIVTREWLALAAYHLKGRTSSLFPR